MTLSQSDGKAQPVLDALARVTLARRFEAMIADLRTAQARNDPVFGAQPELLRYLEWEGHHLNLQYPAGAATADGGQYLIQHIRERAHHQGNDALRDDCDRWLETHHFPHFKSHDAWRYLNDTCLIRTIHIDYHTAGGLPVALSADGRRIISSSWPSVRERWITQLWDTSTGAELRQFKHDDSVGAAVLSADSSRMLFSSNRKVLLWDMDTGAEIRAFEGHEKRVHAVALSADGSRAASGADDNTVRVWDTNSGTELCRFSHSSRLTSVALSADGRRVWSGSLDRPVRLWDTSTREEIFIFDCQPAQIWGVALSADGNLALAGLSDGTARLWNLETGGEPRYLQGHTGNVISVALSPDGSRALTGSHDGTTRLWDTDTGTELRRFDSGRISAVALSADGRLALSAAGKVIRLWDTQSGARSPSHTGHDGDVLSVALSADGSLIASGSNDKTMRFWDTQTGAELRRIDHSTLSGSSVTSTQLTKTRTGIEARPVQGRLAYVSRVALSADGSRALSASGDQTARLWDTETGAELRQFKAKAGDIALSPDGHWALLTEAYQRLELWDLEEETEPSRMVGHTSAIAGAALSADGNLALSGSATGPISGPISPDFQRDDTLRLWNTRTGVELRRFEGHTGDLTSVALSADGRLALSGAKDRTARLWNTQTGAELHRFEGHTDDVMAVALSADGRRALSASNDRTLRLWDTQTGRALAVLQCGAHRMAFAAANPSLIVVGAGSEIRVLVIAMGE